MSEIEDRAVSPKYFTSKQVRHRYGNPSPATWFRWRKAGLVPAPDLVIGRRELWLPATLDAHDGRLAAAKRTGAAA